MARLTIPDEATFAEFTVVTSTSAFPITFSLFAKADLTVEVDGVALEQADFSFSGTPLDGGGYDGGTVTLNDAVDDVTVRIERNVDPTRTSNFAPAGSTPVGSIDLAFNRITATQQDVGRRVGDMEAEVLGAEGAIAVSVATAAGHATTAGTAASGAAASESVASAALQEIAELVADGDDAVSVLDKQAKTQTKVDDLTELTAGLALGADHSLLLREPVTVTSTQVVTASGSIEGGIAGTEIYKPSNGKIFEIEPPAVLGGTLASAVAAGETVIPLVEALPAGLVAGVFVDLGELAHVRLVRSVDTGARTITVNYPTGRAMAKGETVNYRVPIQRYALTRQKLRKLTGGASTGANATFKYIVDLDLSGLTSQDCAGNALTVNHSCWTELGGRFKGPNIHAETCQFGLFAYNCENVHPRQMSGKTFGEYLLQLKDCRDSSGSEIVADGTVRGDVAANIKCSGLHPVWNVHLTGVKGTNCGQAAASMTALRKEGTFFDPFNISVSNAKGNGCQGLQLAADYGSKWDQPNASDISAVGDFALYVADNVPAGVFTNIRGVRSASRTVDVESHGHTFIGGASQDAQYGGSAGSDIRLTAAAYNAIGRLECSDLPANNSNITLNGKVITFKTSGAVAANHECNIGSTVAETIVNLAGAYGDGSGGLLNDSTGPLLTPASYTAWTAALQIEFDAQGSAGDAYTLAVGAGSNFTIFSYDGAATTTLKGGTQVGASNNTFIGWQGRVTDASCGVTRFAQEVSATCNNNRFIYCRLIDLVGKYTTDYTLLGANSQAVAPAWDVVPSMGTVRRRTPLVLADDGSLTQAGAATFNGAVTLGDAPADAVSVLGALTAQMTSGAATVGPRAFLYRNSTSPLAGDLMGELVFSGKDSAANVEEYASIMAVLLDPTSTSEDGALDVFTKAAGVMAARLRIDSQGMHSTMLPTYADNAAALAGSLTAGRFYKTATGEVRIVV